MDTVYTTAQVFDTAAQIYKVEGQDGIETTYGGGDYTLTVWDDMEGNYDLIFTRSNTDIAHHRECGLIRDVAIARMLEFQPDPDKWYPVQFGA
jgi:hypothetical protein